MPNRKTIRQYSDLRQLAQASAKNLWVCLETGHHSGLMQEVVEDFWRTHQQEFDLIKLTGEVAVAIQEELSILKLPALLVLDQGHIVAIFQGLVAKHELSAVLQQLTQKNL